MFVKRRKGGRRECSSVGTGRRKREGRREGRAEQGGGLGLMGEVLEGWGAALEAVASQTGSPTWAGILGCGEGSSGRCYFPGPVQLQTALVKGTFGQTRKVEDWGCFRQA